MLMSKILPSFIIHLGSGHRVGGHRFFVLSALVLYYGCGQELPQEEPGATVIDTGISVRDSAGVLITESPEALATGPLPWGIDSVPALAVGSE